MGAPQGGHQPMGGSPFGPPECAVHAVKHGMNATIRSPGAGAGSGGRENGRPEAPPAGGDGTPRFRGASDWKSARAGRGPSEGRTCIRMHVLPSEAATASVAAFFRGFKRRRPPLGAPVRISPACVRWRTATPLAPFCGARRALHSRVHGAAGRFRQRSGAPIWRPTSTAVVCARGLHMGPLSQVSRALAVRSGRAVCTTTESAARCT